MEIKQWMTIDDSIPMYRRILTVEVGRQIGI